MLETETCFCSRSLIVLALLLIPKSVHFDFFPSHLNSLESFVEGVFLAMNGSISSSWRKILKYEKKKSNCPVRKVWLQLKQVTVTSLWKVIYTWARLKMEYLGRQRRNIDDVVCLTCNKEQSYWQKYSMRVKGKDCCGKAKFNLDYLSASATLIASLIAWFPPWDEHTWSLWIQILQRHPGFSSGFLPC